jgi:Glycerate kinase
MSTVRTNQQVKASTIKIRRRAARHVRIALFLVRRAKQLAITTIIIASGIAVFEGSRYSATVFSFHGVSAWMFALMPDALMVYSAARMRERGLTNTAFNVARTWMRRALAFSIFTNMNAALLHIMPGQEPWLPTYIKIMTVIYHGVVVAILWGATEVATRKHADRQPERKQANTSRAAGPVAQPRKPKPSKASTGSPLLPATQLVPLTSENVQITNGRTPSGLLVSGR